MALTLRGIDHCQDNCQDKHYDDDNDAEDNPDCRRSTRNEEFTEAYRNLPNQFTH